LTYVVYHLISKMRGNEKNIKMNNYGLGVAVLGLWYTADYFIDDGAYSVNRDKYHNWINNHSTLFLWIYWSADSAYLLYHWLFNWRYVKSTFRLPVLEKSAEFHNKMLDRIFKQREEQHVLFSPKELEDHSREMAILKKRQVRQETWSTVIEIVLLLLVIASSYPYVYGGSSTKVENFFHLPMFLLLNIAMLIAVVVMRFYIKRMPNLLVNENLVIIHVLLFTTVTALWIVHRVYVFRRQNAYHALSENKTSENFFAWFYAD